jgi:hypothetical protein
LNILSPPIDVCPIDELICSKFDNLPLDPETINLNKLFFSVSISSNTGFKKSSPKFNIDNWKDKNIQNFESLIKLYNIYENDKILKYDDTLLKYDNVKLSKNILFFELNNLTKEVLKKNMTLVIIGFNQYTYIKNMVEQLEKYTNDIVIIDNNSTFPELLKYYENEYKYNLIKMDKNYGHKVYEKSFINYIIGDIYFLTDPDLEFNKNLPDNFIEKMIDISSYYEAEKVGFALLIDSDDIRNDIKSFGKSIIDFTYDNLWKIKKIEISLETIFN